jgi:hypothetical protein
MRSSMTKTISASPNSTQSMNGLLDFPSRLLRKVMIKLTVACTLTSLILLCTPVLACGTQLNPLPCEPAGLRQTGQFNFAPHFRPVPSPRAPRVAIDVRRVKGFPSTPSGLRPRRPDTSTRFLIGCVAKSSFCRDPTKRRTPWNIEPRRRKHVAQARLTQRFLFQTGPYADASFYG